MIEWLNHIDTALFLALNGIHFSILDTLFWYISQVAIWIPLYAVLLYLIIRQDSKDFTEFHWQTIVGLVVCIALAITMADQLSSGLLKPLVGRLRPSHDPSLQGLVHLLTDPNGHIYKGGKYGFVSSHAANTLALAAFISKALQYRAWNTVIWIWAITVSYSRIYLGVHYPGDIICGGLIGVISGSLFGFIYQKWRMKWIS